MLKNKIIDLHRKGKSYREIEKILGCARSTISYHLNPITKSKTYARDKARKESVKRWLREYKKTLCCSRCDENRPVTLQFHHRDPLKKDFQISEAVSNRMKPETILKEIEKCEVLCANCHAVEHENIRNSTLV